MTVPNLFFPRLAYLLAMQYLVQWQLCSFCIHLHEVWQWQWESNSVTMTVCISLRFCLQKNKYVSLCNRINDPMDGINLIWDGVLRTSEHVHVLFCIPIKFIYMTKKHNYLFVNTTVPWNMCICEICVNWWSIFHSYTIPTVGFLSTLPWDLSLDIFH